MTLAAHPNRFGGICGDYKGNTYSNHENGKVLNCYTDYAVIGSADSNNAGTMEDSECSIDDERFASGEIAYKLNQGREDDKAVWYQTLKTDTSSAFEGARVYYGYQDCRHSDAEYANTYLNSTAEHCYDTEPEFEWSEDYRACEAIFTCSLDSTHEKKEADCKIAEDTSDPEKTIYTASVTMQGNTYTDTQTPKNRVVSITMSWNEMEFDYTVGVWDAENHQYEEGIWSPTKEDGDVLTVTNNGTVELDISAYYEPIEDSEVKGSVTVKDSEAEGSVIVDDPESARFHLALGKQQELYLTLSGEMKKKTKHQQVGTIVLQLEESVSDTENAG